MNDLRDTQRLARIWSGQSLIIPESPGDEQITSSIMMVNLACAPPNSPADVLRILEAIGLHLVRTALHSCRQHRANLAAAVDAHSHHPSSPPSVKALAMLRASLSAPYPPARPDAPPLEFNLEVVESRPPTPDQLRTILSYLAPKDATTPYTTFLSAHPSAPGSDEQPQSAAAIADLGARNPDALKWPVVVDWNGGRASIGDVDGVLRMLEVLRQRRDGELKDEDVVRPMGWFS